MPLESLHLLVETLKKRIVSHGPALKASEALTRYALIDPLLRELGWDTADPSLVIPEYKSGNGRADYALLTSDSKPAMMVEAKSLGSSLRDTALSQGIQYCLEKGTKHFTLTDGNCWEVYETHRPVPIEDKRIVSLDLSKESTAEVCLQSLALWRQSLEFGMSAAGHDPLIQPDTAPPAQTLTHIDLPPDTSDPGSWQDLPMVSPESHADPPTEIRYPDNSRRPIENWRGVVVEITRWLGDEGHFKAGDCPIPYSSRSKQYIVATNPVHPSGKKFTAPREVTSKNIGKLYVETHSSASDCIKKAITVIKHVNLDPVHFKLRQD